MNRLRTPTTIKRLLELSERGPCCLYNPHQSPSNANGKHAYHNISSPATLELQPGAMTHTALDRCGSPLRESVSGACRPVAASRRWTGRRAAPAIRALAARVGARRGGLPCGAAGRHALGTPGGARSPAREPVQHRRTRGPCRPIDLPAFGRRRRRSLPPSRAARTTGAVEPFELTAGGCGPAAGHRPSHRR